MVVQNEALCQKSRRPVVNEAEGSNDIDGNLSPLGCHREYRRTRLVAAGDAFDLLAAIMTIIVPFAVCISICVLDFWSWTSEIGFIIVVYGLPLWYPTMWPCIASVFLSLRKPHWIRVNQRGLEVKLITGTRQVPWQKVRIQIDRKGRAKVDLDGKYKFVVNDELVEFAQLRDVLVARAAGDKFPPLVQPSLLRVHQVGMSHL